MFNSREAGRNCAGRTRRRHVIKASFRKKLASCTQTKRGQFPLDLKRRKESLVQKRETIHETEVWSDTKCNKL